MFIYTQSLAYLSHGKSCQIGPLNCVSCPTTNRYRTTNETKKNLYQTSYFLIDSCKYHIRLSY